MLNLANVAFFIAVAFPLLHAAGAQGGQEAEENIVNNPGFETVGGAGMPTAWHRVSARAEIEPEFLLDAQVARSGTRSAKLSAKGSEGTFGCWSTTVTINGGRSETTAPSSAVTLSGPDFLGTQAYLIECFFKAKDIESIDRNVAVRVEWSDGDGRQLLKGYIHPSGADGEWQRVSQVVTAPRGAHRLTIELVLQWTKRGTVWWDDVSVRRIDAPRRGRKIRVASVHCVPSGVSTPERNRHLYAGKAGEAGKAGADIVCLGESIAVVRTGKNYVDVAESVPGPTSELLGRVARKYRMYVVVGVYEREGALVYNTGLLIGREGEIVGKYRKTHLPETEISGGITPAHEYPVFKTDFGLIGIQICYDNFFPEVARSLALNGAEIIFTPIYGDPRQELYAWDIVARARAIDNAVYFVASTYTPNRRSLIIDPGGRILADTKGEEGIVFADIDLDQRTFERWLSVSGFGEWKNIFPKERRTETYQTPLATGVRR